MKKFNWKLLLVVALALVLVISLFACDPKTDDNNNNEPEPEPEVQTTDVDDFFDELYAVGGGIGQEEIATGKNVYLEAELGLALGTRVRGKEAANPVELGIALKALLDREHEDGKDSAFALDLTVGNAQAISLYYKLSDENVYLALGGQKVKINTKLIGLDKILGGLLNGKIGGDNGKTLPEYVSELAAKTGEDFTFDTFGAFLLQTFGLQSMIDGNATISGVLAPYKDGGVLSLQRLLEADLVRGAFTATKADLGTATRYTASLGHAGEIDGALLNTGMINGMIGGGAGVGDLDVKVSFDADSNHRLQDGVKVSLDLIVDQANELYASLPGAGSSKEYPFVQINIKHLNLQDGTGERVLPLDKYNYKDNMQIDVKENIEIKGIKISGANGTKLPKNIELRLLANLDLGNTENNQTKLRFYLKQTVEEGVQRKETRKVPSTVKEGEEDNYTEYFPLADYDQYIFDFIYADGRLTHTFDPDANIVPGYFGWGSLLHEPIGNLIKGVIEKVDPAQAETFKEHYDHQVQGESSMAGMVYDFKGMVIDNLQVADIVDFVKNLVSAPATTSEDEQPETPATSVKEKNMYNAIVKVFTLIDAQENGQFGLKLRGILDEGTELLQYFGLSSITIQNKEDPENPTVLPLTKDALFPFLKNAVEGFMSVLTSDGLLTFDGCTEDDAYPGGTFIQKLNYLFAFDENDDANVTFNFDFTNGVNWELYWLAQDNEEVPAQYKPEKVVSPGQDYGSFYEAGTIEKGKLISKSVEDLSIRYTSAITINSTSEPIVVDEYADLFDKKAKYEAGIKAAQQDLETKQAAAVEPDATYDKKKAAYEATAEYKDYVKAQADYTAAVEALTNLTSNNLQVVSNWYTATIGKISSIYSHNSKNNSSKNLYKWVTAGKHKEDTDKDWVAIKAAVKTGLDNLETNYKAGKFDENVYNTYKAALTATKDGEGNITDVGGELWEKYLAECEALIALENAQKKAETNDLKEYKEFKEAETAKKTADKAVSDAQAAVDALEDPYFVYFYMDMNDYKKPAEPQPAPTEPEETTPQD